MGFMVLKFVFVEIFELLFVDVHKEIIMLIAGSQPDSRRFKLVQFVLTHKCICHPAIYIDGISGAFEQDTHTGKNAVCDIIRKNDLVE